MKAQELFSNFLKLKVKIVPCVVSFLKTKIATQDSRLLWYNGFVGQPKQQKERNMQALYFDMDGTIANLYDVPHWKTQLENENVAPYEIAAPLCNMDDLAQVVESFRALGIVVGVVSWGAMNGSKEYTRRVKRAKMEWCKRHGLYFSEFHVVKYGTPKHSVTRIKHDAILIDDNSDVRNAWTIGGTIDANLGVVEELCRLLKTLDPGAGIA